MLPSPACGRGVRGEGRRKHEVASLRGYAAALPRPSPRGRGEKTSASLCFPALDFQFVQRPPA
ncbi:hypothetical protein CBM2606_A110003 [Cupriavidus taiwanensis]|nr:hypothetical protein CBM2606_A110003 [Cupriavidus taiwanensis]